MTTRPYKSSTYTYLKAILLIWLVRYGWAVALPLLVALIAGMTVDVRWLLVGIVMFFIFIPMLISWLYVYYMLTPAAHRAITLKQVTYVPGEPIIIDFLTTKEDADETSKYEITGTEIIPDDQIRSVSRLGSQIMITMRTKRLTILLIPITSISKSQHS